MNRTPFQRRSVSLPGKSAKQRRRLRPRSKKMAAYYRDVRVPAVMAAVGDGTNPCQARTAACTGYVETLHEPASRGRFGGLIPAVRAGGELPTCGRCNNWISEHPRESLALGLLKKGK